MLNREASVDELLMHPYFDELFDDEGRLQHFRESRCSQVLSHTTSDLLPYLS